MSDTTTQIGARGIFRERVGSHEVLAAVGLVRKGRVFDLGTKLDRDMPRGPDETFHRVELSQHRVPQCLYRGEGPPFDFSMDIITGSPHLGSHLDAFAHIQSRGRVFPGIEARSVFDDFGWRANGVETVPPIVSRGILLDMARAHAVEALPDGFEITTQHVQDCLEAQATELRRGDVVLVRTGKFAVSYKDDGTEYFKAQAGVGVDAALWLYEQGMSMLGTDTSVTEPFPFPDPERTVHVAMLVERGVHLLEILDLEELAHERAYEFLFVCLPLKFTGATGSWVRPVAIV